MRRYMHPARRRPRRLPAEYQEESYRAEGGIPKPQVLPGALRGGVPGPPLPQAVEAPAAAVRSQPAAAPWHPHRPVAVTPPPPPPPPPPLPS